jgi:hypothetical protein
VVVAVTAVAVAALVPMVAVLVAADSPKRAAGRSTAAAEVAAMPAEVAPAVV